MKTLFIETSTEKAAIALWDGENLEQILLNGDNSLSSTLSEEVAKLCKEKPDLIAVGTGPGSLTGTRIGVSLANALSFAWKIPLTYFCSLNAHIPLNPKTPFAILVDARSQGIHALVNGEENILFSPDKLIPSDFHLYSPHPHLIEKKVLRKCEETSIHFSEKLLKQS